MNNNYCKVEPYFAISEIYDKLYPTNYEKLFYDNLNSVIEKLRINNSNILDIGSGTSNNSKFWTDLGFKYYCIEPSFAMISQYNKGNINENVHQICGDYKCLSEQKKFNIVIALNDVVNYIAFCENDLSELFTIIYSILEENSILVFDLLNTDCLSTLIGSTRILSYDSTKVEINYNQLIDLERYIFKKEYFVEKHNICNYYEEHFLEIVELKKVINILKSVGFDVIATGDLLFRNYSFENLPSIDIMSIKK